jgi:NAD(P) transhydrogenase
MAEHYDMLVIGSGPGGQRAAIQASKLGKRVAVVEKSDQLGGAALRAGTIPTKALREAALVLSGAAGTGLLADKRVIRRDITLDELSAVTREVMIAQLRVLEDAFARNYIKVIWGHARFEGEQTVVVEDGDGGKVVTADRFVLAKARVRRGQSTSRSMTGPSLRPTRSGT